MRKLACSLALGLLIIAATPCVDWFESDASGIALTATSAFLARKLPWALSVEDATAEFLKAASPMARAQIAQGGLRAEIYSLHRDGNVHRQVLRILDAQGRERFRETRDNGLLEFEAFDAQGNALERFRQIDAENGELETSAYRSGRLENIVCASLRMDDLEKRSEAQLLWTDSFRYLRDGTLRSVLRAWSKPETKPSRALFSIAAALPRRIVTSSASGLTLSSDYDAQGREVYRSLLDSAGGELPGSERIRYENGISVYSSEDHAAGTRSERDYGADGQLLEERSYDSENELIAQTRYTWKGQQLVAIERTSDEGLSRTEYVYDDEDEVVDEKNYRDGMLERHVYRDGEGSIEELFMDGALMIRARWENERKVWEQRFVRYGESR